MLVNNNKPSPIAPYIGHRWYKPFPKGWFIIVFLTLTCLQYTTFTWYNIDIANGMGSLDEMATRALASSCHFAFSPLRLLSGLRKLRQCYCRSPALAFLMAQTNSSSSLRFVLLSFCIMLTCSLRLQLLLLLLSVRQADCHQRVRRKSQVLAQSVLSNLQNKELCPKAKLTMIKYDQCCWHIYKFMSCDVQMCDLFLMSKMSKLPGAKRRWNRCNDCNGRWYHKTPKVRHPIDAIHCCEVRSKRNCLKILHGFPGKMPGIRYLEGFLESWPKP